MSSNMPKKISLVDKIKILFSDKLERLLRSNLILKSQKAELEAKNKELLEQNRTQEEEYKKLKEEYRNLSTKQSELKKELESTKQLLEMEQEKTAQEGATPSKIIYMDEISTYFERFIMEEKKKLENELRQMEEFGGISNDKKLRYIELYQAKILGAFFAFTKMDTESVIEVQEECKKRLKDIYHGMDYERRKMFEEAFRDHRYSEIDVNYKREPCIDHDFRTLEETSTWVHIPGDSAYSYRTDFSKLGISTEIVDRVKGYGRPQEPKQKTYIAQLKRLAGEKAGYGVKDMLEDREN